MNKAKKNIEEITKLYDSVEFNYTNGALHGIKEGIRAETNPHTTDIEDIEKLKEDAKKLVTFLNILVKERLDQLTKSNEREIHKSKIPQMV